MQELIMISIRASLFVTVLSIGLDARMEAVTYLVRKPRLLLRSFLAIVVIVPAFAALLVAALALPQAVEIGILLMAVAPLPPFVPATEVRLGAQKSYVYGLLATFALLSIVTVPLTVAILGAVFADHMSVSPVAVARLVFLSVLLPLALGMLIRALAPGVAARTAPLAGKIANLVLIVVSIPVLVVATPAMLKLIGNGTVLAIEAVVAVALLAGHVLGGPHPYERVALALSSAARHPGIALMIAAANVAEAGVKATILLFLILGVLTGVAYQLWAKRHVLVTHQA
jgi:BASS family bile acid:Na+ symporter